jgi:hypothetical protein
MAGHGGMIYQLLRLHPDAGLPSVLTLGGPDEDIPRARTTGRSE